MCFKEKTLYRATPEAATCSAAKRQLPLRTTVTAQIKIKTFAFPQP
jgi:hypothetical protein